MAAACISARNFWPLSRHRLRQVSNPAASCRLLPDRQIPASFAHGAKRITAISIGQRKRIISERTELKTELTMGEKANDDGLFNARTRTREKLRQSVKLNARNFRQLVLVPTLRMDIADELLKQVRDRFHRSAACLKEK